GPRSPWPSHTLPAGIPAGRSSPRQGEVNGGERPDRISVPGGRPGVNDRGGADAGAGGAAPGWHATPCVLRPWYLLDVCGATTPSPVTAARVPGVDPGTVRSPPGGLGGQQRREAGRPDLPANSPTPGLGEVGVRQTPDAHPGRQQQHHRPAQYPA